MKLQYTIPTEKNEINLETYLDVQRLIKEEAEDNIIVAKIIGVEHHYIKYIPVAEFEEAKQFVLKALQQTTDLQRVISINGVKYGFMPNIEKITVGEFADLETLFSDPINNAYQLMNVMYRPITKERRDTYLIEPYNSDNDVSIFKNIPCTVYDNAVGFFLTLKKQLQNAILKSMEEEQVQKKVETLRRNGHGIKHSIQ